MNSSKSVDDRNYFGTLTEAGFDNYTPLKGFHRRTEIQSQHSFPFPVQLCFLIILLAQNLSYYNHRAFLVAAALALIGCYWRLSTP